MLIGVGTCTVNIGVQPISFDTASLIVECMYFFGVKGLQTGPSSCSTPHSLKHALPFKTCRLWYNTKIQIKAALYITLLLNHHHHHHHHSSAGVSHFLVDRKENGVQ